jgi:hypothetical protein
MKHELHAFGPSSTAARYCGALLIRKPSCLIS